MASRHCYTIVMFSLLAVAVILSAIGISLIFVFENMTRNKIFEQMPLKNGSVSYENWRVPPAPVYMQFWFFDVRNAHEVVTYGDKPILQEVGPLTYREIRPKENISHEGDTLSYVQPKAFVFVPSMSAISEDQVITFVNLPLLTIAKMAEKAGMGHILNIAIAVTNSGLFARRSVGELLWGYTEPVLEMISKLTPSIDPHVGLFYGPTGNGSNDGVYTIFTGEDDVFKLNVIEKWNGASNLTYWNTTYCNMINGTDGSMYHPFISREETLDIFASDICRSLPMKYSNDEAVKGIPTYRFTPPPSVFADHRDNPDNIGYCTPDCLKAGVLNVSVCRDGAPIIMSQPHFYQGDPDYINAMYGLHPDGRFHATYIDVEPHTGAVLNAAKKLQLNAYIDPMEAISDTLKYNKVIFPLVWLNESAVLDDSDAATFRQTVLKPLLMAQVVQYGLVTAGALLLIVVLSCFIHVKRKGQPLYKHVQGEASSPSSTEAERA